MLGGIFNSKPLGLLWSFFSRWKWGISVSSLAVLYWVFSGLTKIGFIDYVSKTLESSLKDSVAIAKNCTPQIANIKTFFECIQHPENFNFHMDNSESEAHNFFQNELTKKKEFKSNNPNKFYELLNPYYNMMHGESDSDSDSSSSYDSGYDSDYEDNSNARSRSKRRSRYDSDESSDSEIEYEIEELKE